MAVIGAGPAGLTAALLLAREGIPVTVLEADAVVGGLSRTSVYNGYRFDLGGHRFFTKHAPVEDLWTELLGDELIWVPRLSRIHYAGHFFDYPLKPGNALSKLGPATSLQILFSYLRSRLRPTPVEENFEQWVSNRFGRRLYEIFFKAYTEKVWGTPCTEIRAEWAAQRIQNLSLWTALRTASPLTRRKGDVRSLIERFQYPRLGPGQMWEACRDRVLEMGGEVRMKHRVTACEVEGGRMVAVRAAGPDGEVRVEADHFISSMPVRSLVRSLKPAPPPKVSDAGEGLRYRDFLLVALILDGEELFPDNWIYIHTPGFRVGRIQNFNNWSRAMVPEAGRTCLGMEYFCFRSDDLWNMPDEGLVAMATRELQGLGLAGGRRVLDGTVVRVPKAYPIYDSEYRGHLRGVKDHLDGISNLQLIGRNGMHKYNNQDHSMLTAMMAVRNLHGASFDLWDVNTDFEYHEEMRLDRVDRPAKPGLWPEGERSPDAA